MHLKCSAFAGTCVMHSNRKHPISQKKKKKLVTFNDLVNSQTHYKLMSLSSRSENLIFNRLFFIFYISPQFKRCLERVWFLLVTDWFFFSLSCTCDMMKITSTSFHILPSLTLTIFLYISMLAVLITVTESLVILKSTLLWVLGYCACVIFIAFLRINLL